MHESAQAIKEAARRAGYARCGITSAEAFGEFGAAIARRIRRFPEASGLYSAMRSRANPRARNPWARSIVVCARRYGKYEIPPGLAGRIGRAYLFDRRNPGCPDHAMPERMKAALVEMGLRVRRGGTPDRWAAARSGVARFGRNCFAYSEHGSWINIETWLVDAELPPDDPAMEPARCPPGCRACIDACPTGALVEPFVMRMDRCIAYLTYAAPEPIPADLWRRMGSWIYGCDRCQEVCPLNDGAWENLEKPAWLQAMAQSLQPEALAAMDERTYRRVVQPAFWYVSADNVSRWHANARRALRHEPEE